MDTNTIIFFVVFFLCAILFAILVNILRELFKRFIRNTADKIVNFFTKKD